MACRYIYVREKNIAESLEGKLYGYLIDIFDNSPDCDICNSILYFAGELNANLKIHLDNDTPMFNVYTGILQNTDFLDSVIIFLSSLNPNDLDENYLFCNIMKIMNFAEWWQGLQDLISEMRAISDLSKLTLS